MTLINLRSTPSAATSCPWSTTSYLTASPIHRSPPRTRRGTPRRPHLQLALPDPDEAGRALQGGMSRRRPHPAAGQDHPRGDRVRVPRQHDPRQPPSRGGSTAPGRDGARIVDETTGLPRKYYERGFVGVKVSESETANRRPSTTTPGSPSCTTATRHRSRPHRRGRGGARAGEARVRPLDDSPRLKTCGERGRASPRRVLRRRRGEEIVFTYDACSNPPRRRPVGYLPADPGQGPLAQRGEQRDDLAVSQRHGGDDHDPHASWDITQYNQLETARDCRETGGSCSRHVFRPPPAPGALSVCTAPIPPSA